MPDTSLTQLPTLPAVARSAGHWSPFIGPYISALSLEGALQDPIALYFLVLLPQHAYLLLYLSLLHQEPAVEVVGNTLCIVRPYQPIPVIALLGPINSSRPRFPGRPRKRA